MQPESERVDTEEGAVDHKRVHGQRCIKVLIRFQTVEQEIFHRKREMLIVNDENPVIPVPEKRIIQSGIEYGNEKQRQQRGADEIATQFSAER